MADLTQPPQEIATLAALLSPDERARAARFRQPRDRDRFIVARSLLRTILGRYLDRDPGTLRFAYHCVCGDPACRPERRKPTLATEMGADWLQFNVTHADDLALFALARDHAIGIDLERHDRTLDLVALAPFTLAAAEWAALRTLPAARQHSLFTHLWTAKEAYVKARGSGLRLSPEQVVIAATETGALRLHSVAGDLSEAARWHLASFVPCADYSAAVVSAGPIAALRVGAIESVHASAR